MFGWYWLLRDTQIRKRKVGGGMLLTFELGSSVHRWIDHVIMIDRYYGNLRIETKEIRQIGKLGKDFVVLYQHYLTHRHRPPDLEL